MDELYDSDSDGLDQDDIDADAWRALWVGTYRPGSLGALLHKSVYVYSDLEDNTPDSADEYTYTYDPVGNVAYVYDQSGNLAYEFSQDAFGNELEVGTLGGSDWHDAAGDGIVEHQTGKWMDEFTGLYYFWARWYCGEVGRFIARDVWKTEDQYLFCGNSPNRRVDVTGKRNYLVGDAVARTIRLRECNGSQEHVGEVVNLAASPVGNGENPDHNGYSIPEGVYSFVSNYTGEARANRPWFYIYDNQRREYPFFEIGFFSRLCG